MGDGSVADGSVADGLNRELARLQERAVAATAVAFTLTDPRQADNPLIWVNPAFCRMTGYALDEVVGRNCRFLQGPETSPETIAELREAVTEGRSATVTMRNRRKDGTPFWNRLSVDPVQGDDGQVVAFVGTQVDVTDKVEAAMEREEALAAEQSARLAVERTQGQLAFMSDVTSQLISTLDIGESLVRIADLAVPQVADWAVIYVVDEDISTEGQIVIRHRHGHHRLADRYAELLPTAILPGSLTERLRAGDEPVLLRQAGLGDLQGSVAPEVLEIVERFGLGSLMAVPLVARRQRVLGVMILVCQPDGRTYDDGSLEVAVELGRRAGLILDNLRLYRQEREAAEILQHSLLPVVPELDGVAVATRYLPAHAATQVGGDFYEILQLEDGAIGVAVGDVVGHDLHAASAMGHLRGLLRACALDSGGGPHGASPARVLSRVDRLMRELRAAPLATLVYARLATTGDGWQLRVANAGHPAMLLRRPDGTVTVLDEGRGLLLGVTDAPRDDLEVVAPIGSLLVGFTDGLVERRGTDIAVGMDRIAAILAGDLTDDLEDLVDRMVGTLEDQREDDVAVVAVRLGSVVDPQVVTAAGTAPEHLG